MKDHLTIGIPRKLIDGKHADLLYAYTCIKALEGQNFTVNDITFITASAIAFEYFELDRNGQRSAKRMLELLCKNKYVSKYDSFGYTVSYGQLSEETNFLAVTIGSFNKVRRGCNNPKDLWSFYCFLMGNRTSDDFMVCRKSQAELAQASGLSRGTIIKYLKILQDLGLIYVKNRVMTESGEYQTNIIGAAKDRAAIDKLYPGTKDVRNTRAAQSAAARYNQFVRRGPDKYSEEEVEEIEAETKKYNRLTKGKKLDTSVFEAAEPEVGADTMKAEIVSKSSSTTEIKAAEPKPVKERDPIEVYWEEREKRLAKLKAEKSKEPEEPEPGYDWSKRKSSGPAMTDEELAELFEEVPKKPKPEPKPAKKPEPKIVIEPSPLVPYVDPDDPEGKVRMIPPCALPSSHPDWLPEDGYFLAMAEAQAAGYWDDDERDARDAREFENDPWYDDFDVETAPAVRELLDKASNTDAIDPPKEPSEFIKNTPFPEDDERGPAKLDPYADMYAAE